jgi:hypothetical protein
MTSSLGNGAHSIAPGFEGARITPAQAEALAAGFLPSWESEAGVVAIGAVSNGHAGGDLRSTMKSNGVHAESHAPPSRTIVNEPEDSVVIDRSITADQLAAPPPDSARVPVATVRLAPPVAQAVSPSVAPAPPPPSLRPMPPPASMRPAPPPRAARPAARTPSIDYEIAAPKSKKGLFIGLGLGAAAILAVGIGIAVSSGDSSKANDSGGPTITVVKPDDSAKAPPAPPPATTQAAAAKPIATTPTATATATTPPVPVTALPVAATPDAPRAKPTRTAAPQPQSAPQPRAAQPRSGGNTAIVKDVPF